MPTYEYACTACGNEFERFESITAKPNKTCPKCNAKKGERKISGGGGFIFKGTGFYLTDYKKSSGGKAASESSESKPAATAATATDTSTTASGGGCATGCGCHSTPAPAKVEKSKSSSSKAPSKKS